jgi:hypothetical protein
MRSIAIKGAVTFSAVFSMLVLVACAQTPATQTPRLPQEETPPASQSSSSASSGTPVAEQQESREKSESSQAAAAEKAGTRPEEKKPSTAAEAGKQKPGESPGTVAAAAENSADARLAQARENLRISRETEKRIASELTQLKASGTASDEAVKDYETYLKSVQAMTAENRKMVAQMEAAYAQQPPAQAGSQVPMSNAPDGVSAPGIPEEQAVDEVAALDRQLNTSLAKFDDMLLKEMDAIRAGSSRKLQDLAEEAAEAARRLRAKGLDVDTSGSKPSGEKQKTPEGQVESGRKMEPATGRAGTETVAKDGSRKGGEGPSNQNQRRGDYEDDDIVARQLREAAENETDPELKEKLWKEYEAYKKSK